MQAGLEPTFASGRPSWPLAGMRGFEPDDPDLEIPQGALQNGVREAPEPYFEPHHDAAVTHTATVPLAPAKAAQNGRKATLSIAASFLFHAAIAAAFLYVAGEDILIEGADFTGIAVLGEGADQIKAGEISDTQDNAVEVTMVTMLDAKPVETVEAEAVPVEETTEAVDVAEAVTERPETVQPVAEAPAEQVVEQPAEAVPPQQQAQVAPAEPQQPVEATPAPVEPAESAPAPTVTQTTPEVLATDLAEKVDDDNFVQQPARTEATEPVEAAEAVQSQPSETVTETQEQATAPSETTEQAQPAETVPAETEAVEPETEVVEAEAIETPAEAPRPEPKPQQQAEPKRNEQPTEKKTARQEPPREAPKKEAAEKPPQKRAAEGRKTAEKAEPRQRRAGNGGQNETNARRGQADGQEKGDSRQASRGGSKNRQVGNAAVSNYPGKVRSKLARVARGVRANGRGEVVVSFAVGSNGGVRSARVSRSSGDAGVDQAALQAVRKAAPFPPIPEGAGRSSWEFSVPLAFRR